MGIFGGGYTTPGKGISKEDAAKRNYFDILGRKFWKLLQVNLLYVLCNILFFGSSILLAISYDWNTILDVLVSGQTIFLPPLPFLPLMLTGPFTAGLTYIIRNYSRQEHAFLISDFFEHTKKNIKQGLLMSVIQVLVLYMFFTAFLFYRQFFLVHGWNLGILLGITIIFSIMLLTMSFYIYPMMVTFDMKLRHIIKNSWIFAIAKLPQNLIILLIIGAVHILLLWYVPILWILFMCLILISWSSYTINYYVWHIIDKYMISQLKDTEEKEENIFDDDLLNK